MKKLISLLLVIIFISTALAGCDWKSIFNKSENVDDITSISTTTTTTTTTANPLFPENPTIEHGDNFTYEDIEFLMHLHGQKMGENSEESIPCSLYDVTLDAQRGTPLYLMKFENPYVISGYRKPDYKKPQKDENGFYYFDISQYIWYKFDDYESITQIMEDMNLPSVSYMLFDCTVVEDVANNEEYNKHCKYYQKYSFGEDFTKFPSNMIVYFKNENVIQDNNHYIQGSLSKKRYEVYIDTNGIPYLFFKHETYLVEDGSLHKNYSKDLFFEYEP